MQFVLLVCSPIHSLHFPDSQHTVAEIHPDQGDLFPDPNGWANRMLAAIDTLPADHGVGAIPDLNRLASHYLTHLCIARMLPVIQCLYPSDSHHLSVWNPPGPSTPQASTHPTPDHYRTSTIKELIKQSTEKRVSALKKLVLSMNMLYLSC